MPSTKLTLTHVGVKGERRGGEGFDGMGGPTRLGTHGPCSKQFLLKRFFVYTKIACQNNVACLA